MSDRVNPIDLEVLPLLVWPKDKATIASLSLQDKIYWYSSIAPQTMVFLGSDPKFKSFWYWTYLLPLRIKRIVYKIKAFLRNPFA